MYHKKKQKKDSPVCDWMKQKRLEEYNAGEKALKQHKKKDGNKV